MNNSVIIKGNKYGIVVVLDKDVSFEQLKQDLIDKFKSASKFFDKASMAISFEGRKLSTGEEQEILNLIAEHSDLNIVCVIDNDAMREQYFKKAVEEKLEELSSQRFLIWSISLCLLRAWQIWLRKRKLRVSPPFVTSRAEAV